MIQQVHPKELKELHTQNYIPKRIFKKGTLTEICTASFIASLFTIVRGWKQYKCSSLDKQTNETCYTCTVKCYSPSKRKEVLTDAATWMSLEDIILGEIRRLRKNKHCMDPLI